VHVRVVVHVVVHFRIGCAQSSHLHELAITSLRCIITTSLREEPIRSYWRGSVIVGGGFVIANLREVFGWAHLKRTCTSTLTFFWLLKGVCGLVPTLGVFVVASSCTCFHLVYPIVICPSTSATQGDLAMSSSCQWFHWTIYDVAYFSCENTYVIRWH